MDDLTRDALALTSAEVARINDVVGKAVDVVEAELANLGRRMPFGIAGELAVMLLGRELADHQEPEIVRALQLGLSRAPLVSLHRQPKPKLRGNLRLISSSTMRLDETRSTLR